MLNTPEINKDSVLLFDLDGTLFDTDQANNEAYKYALWKVTGTSDYPALAHEPRITREQIALLDGINAEKRSEIIDIKQNAFAYQLRQGHIATFISYEILKQYYEYVPCYIITSADKKRAELLIDWYDLEDYVKGIFFVERANKYKDIADKLGVESSNIILFEDDEETIASAIENGITEEHIIRVKDDTLRKHIIMPNDYLKHTTCAFYSLNYIGFERPKNPDFINTLKNQFGFNDASKLRVALESLKKYLIEDILSIYNILGFDELTVVAIPRAKAEAEYQHNQQLFRSGIQEAIEYLRNKNNIKLVDGSHYIVRHTNTKTTHLSKNTTVENDGSMPYVGITKETCTILDQVKGKNILLIDDIYTKGVNIDEDAIQALYDNGAKSVIFYSVCKTYKR